MVERLLFATALCPLALAFSNTVPFLTWSSYPSKPLEQLSSSVKKSQTLFQSLLLNENICELDSVIFVSQEGLHASDLRALSPSSKFVRMLREYTSQRQFQYVRPQQSADLSDTVETIAKRCGFDTIDLVPGATSEHLTHDSKNVINIRLPSLEGEIGGTRKDKASLYTSQLANDLEYLSSMYPKHLVIYTGISAATFSVQHDSRQHIETEDDATLTWPVFDFVSVPSNTTLAQGGILKRYQLLTPGLITSLLVVLFILLPILSFGFKALASIQSPLETEAPNKFSADEKKRQ
ncbi:hypothetical protein E4T56_gene8053 [Termitomyces sp. T112]|nr:hypothetical protein E4T56_gene8053 [Termitomyces sp. T112]KNZ74012.1 hypothetical protein J132_08666 [Termitomyces sp. J132]